VPWQFNLPDSGYEAAWRFLLDTASFFSPRGPTTAERGDPLFYVSPQCAGGAVTSGRTPHADAGRAGHLLDDYHQSVATKADYFRLFKTYTLDQRWKGRPYIAESANPDNGSWEGANSFYPQRALFPLGIRGPGHHRTRRSAPPARRHARGAPARARRLGLLRARPRGLSRAPHRDCLGPRRDPLPTGGRGLMLFVDGRRVAAAPRLGRLAASLGAPVSLPPVDRPVNLAVNNDGTPYPKLTASFSAPTTPPFYANDGNRWYHASPANRWTAAGSGHAADWIVVDFGVARPVEAGRALLRGRWQRCASAGAIRGGAVDRFGLGDDSPTSAVLRHVPPAIGPIGWRSRASKRRRSA